MHAQAATRKLMSASFQQHVTNWQELCDALSSADLRTEMWKVSCDQKLNRIGNDPDTRVNTAVPAISHTH